MICKDGKCKYCDEKKGIKKMILSQLEELGFKKNAQRFKSVKEEHQKKHHKK